MIGISYEFWDGNRYCKTRIGWKWRPFDRLKAALIFLIDFYDGKRDIPKRLASAFIDITPLFERAIDFYNQKEQDQIEDIRNKVVSLATDLLFME